MENNFILREGTLTDSIFVLLKQEEYCIGDIEFKKKCVIVNLHDSEIKLKGRIFSAIEKQFPEKMKEFKVQKMKIVYE